ncbi:hypothetical protein N0V88_000415 [Collariella sp. IMI 366227]|nr:hypothetical protein N0V88_000415 [Collariella sp. IMI 366227]
MNKNWNDRADKDLFFTILSVKSIGVISGSEWTTIGNQMRSMGYGFTNEGCRQHFQGLPIPSSVTAGMAPQAPMTMPDDLAVDPSLEDEPEDGRDAKRQRMSDSQDPSLEEVAMMNALASHNNPTTPGAYTSEQSGNIKMSDIEMNDTSGDVVVTPSPSPISGGNKTKVATKATPKNTTTPSKTGSKGKAVAALPNGESIIAMTPKGSGEKPFETKWTPEAHTILLATFVDIATEGGKVTLNGNQDKIQGAMARHGFGFSWEAIRYVQIFVLF